MALISMPKVPEELRHIIRRYRRAFITVGILSAMLNLLVLGGSLYMMMVYDSVLPSHSIPTLFGLLVLLIFAYVFQGLFDSMRSQIMGDIANAFDHSLSRRVQMAMTDMALLTGRKRGDGLTPMRDLEAVRSWLSSNGPASLIDLPWIIFFILVLMMLHIWLGVTALVGAILLVGLTVVTSRVTETPTARLGMVTSHRNALAESNLRHAELLKAMGMRGRLQDRWQQINAQYLAAHRSVGSSVGTLGVISRMGRLLLQSVILTVGALLVIKGEVSGGTIFASSILAARALAPVDQAIAGWRTFAAARQGWGRLCELFDHIQPPADIKTVLPRPREALQVQQLAVIPPGTQKVSIQGVDFTLNAGDALAVIGPSAAGKSSLGRALVGIWNPARGSVRMDGASIDQWSGDHLGELIGYLPQTVELLEGTIAENISRFDHAPASEDIIKAAREAGVHEMIVGLPLGYQTPVGTDGKNLSGGQQQRIALARALYKEPFLVLLDEPNSNLDADGDAALEQAIAAVRARSGIVVVIAHRPSTLSKVNLILYLRDGRVEAFGPRDELLPRLMARPVSIPGGRQDKVGGDGGQSAAAAGGN